MDTSTKILQRLGKGSSTTAWRQFYGRYRDLVRGVARHSGLSEADQDEVLQETMLAVHRNMKFDGMNGPKARAWLRTVSRRKIMDILRKRYQARRSQEASLKSASLTDVRLELEKAWEEEWKVEILERALATLRRELPPKMYQAFDLFALRNHDATQVARTLGISRGLVYLHKLRVLERLRAEVQRMARRLS